jgi:TonB family protein
MMLEILANSAIRLVLVGAAVVFALRIARVRNPHAEALVWRLVVLAGLVMPALLYWRLAPSFETSLQLPLIAAANPGSPHTSALAPSSTTPSMGVLASIYFGIGLLLLGRLLAALVVMWRVSRAALRMSTADDVRTSAQVRSPATFGTIILLPADAHAWPADRLAAVLAHERAHVRSRDGLWSWLAQLHAAIFWLNPLAWWLPRRLGRLAETISDDAVVAARHDPVAYAALLLDFARHPNCRRVVMSVAESNVPERIERLLARTPPAAAMSRIVRWTAFALLIPGAMFAASTTRAAPPSRAVPPSAPAAANAPLPGDVGVSILRTVNPDDYYPAVALAQQVPGSVTVKATVDPMGQLVDVVVVKAQPADPQFGFADAALEVARSTKYRNSRNETASFVFMVKFALQD